MSLTLRFGFLCCLSFLVKSSPKISQSSMSAMDSMSSYCSLIDKKDSTLCACKKEKSSHHGVDCNCSSKVTKCQPGSGACLCCTKVNCKSGNPAHIDPQSSSSFPRPFFPSFKSIFPDSFGQVPNFFTNPFKIDFPKQLSFPSFNNLLSDFNFESLMEEAKKQLTDINFNIEDDFLKNLSNSSNFKSWHKSQSQTSNCFMIKEKDKEACSCKQERKTKYDEDGSCTCKATPICKDSGCTCCIYWACHSQSNKN